MAKLSLHDRETIRSMREASVLDNIEAHRLNQRQGVTIFTCADADQIGNIFRHQQKLCRTHRRRARVHLFALNGGALLIPKTSPLCGKKHREDLALIKHIKQAVALKGIKTVVLYAHAPCGAAGFAKLDFAQVVGLLIDAKKRLKRAIPGIKVACYCHVAIGRKKRSYFVSAVRYRAWRKSQKEIARKR